jgi:hypothetical protein
VKSIDAQRTSCGAYAAGAIVSNVIGAVSTPGAKFEAVR